MHLRPSTFTFLVGKNDAGKSSVLYAVNLDLKLQAEISAQLFYDVAEAITFNRFVKNICGLILVPEVSQAYDKA